MFPPIHLVSPLVVYWGKLIGLLNFPEGEKIVLNLKKCKEMVLDFRKNKSVVPPLEVNGHVFERVKSYKLLGMWIDNGKLTLNT